MNTLFRASNKVTPMTNVSIVHAWKCQQQEIEMKRKASGLANKSLKNKPTGCSEFCDSKIENSEKTKSPQAQKRYN